MRQPVAILTASSYLTALAAGALAYVAPHAFAARPVVTAMRVGAPVCRPDWHIMALPRTGTAFFSGVAAVSDRDVWAVGSVGTGSLGQPLAARWDGERWRVANAGLEPVTPPSTFSIYGDGAVLAAVSALTPRDVWAVGFAMTDAGARPLVVRWTGARWRTTATPYAGPDARLRAVAAISTHDVWAVGDVGGHRALVEHWDGRAWRIVPTPRVGGQDVLFSGLVALTASDVWAAGSRGSAAGSSRRGLVEHWDGARWRVVPTPQPGAVDDAFGGIAANSPHDIWAVGSAEGSDYENVPLVERWDGRAWRVATRPPVPQADSNLVAVAVRSPRDVWAAGGGSLAHWTGARWSITTLRTSRYVPGGDYTLASTPELAAVTADPRAGRWAVGRVVLQTDEQDNPLVAHAAASCGPRRP